LDRVDTGIEHDRNGRGRTLGRERRRAIASKKDRDLPTNEVRREARQPIVLTLCPTVFERDVLTLDIASLSESLPERDEQWSALGQRRATEKSDHRHRLLRARRERPRGRRAAEQRDEFAAVHSITSSAICWRCTGTSRPSALAVLRLIRNSNLVGCSTGRSPGLAPFSILSA
jgi:hypothetical protein